MNYIIICFLPLFFCQCSHYFYTPESHNVPLLSEKNDLHVELKSSFGAEGFDNTEMQSAYAITNRIGIMGSALLGTYETSVSNEQQDGISYESANGNISFFNIGAGFFTPVWEKFVFETYLGYGIGNVKNVYDNIGESKLRYGKPFIQPSFGYKTKYFEAAISSRLNSLNYYKIEDSQTPIHFRDRFTNNIRNNKNSLLLEPAITARGGWKKLKIQLQLSKSYNLNNDLFRFNEDNNFFDNKNNTRISIGVVYSINMKRAVEM